MDSRHTAARAANGGPAVTIGGPLPVPVSGTVSAQQSGAWNVGISGTPSVNVTSLPAVNLAGGTSVNVANTAAAPLFFVNANDPGRIPYQPIVEIPTNAPAHHRASSHSVPSPQGIAL